MPRLNKQKVWIGLKIDRYRHEVDKIVHHLRPIDELVAQHIKTMHTLPYGALDLASYVPLTMEADHNVSQP